MLLMSTVHSLTTVNKSYIYYTAGFLGQIFVSRIQLAGYNCSGNRAVSNVLQKVRKWHYERQNSQKKSMIIMGIEKHNFAQKPCQVFFCF